MDSSLGFIQGSLSWDACIFANIISYIIRAYMYKHGGHLRLRVAGNAVVGGVHMLKKSDIEWI